MKIQRQALAIAAGVAAALHVVLSVIGRLWVFFVDGDPFTDGRTFMWMLVLSLLALAVMALIDVGSAVIYSVLHRRRAALSVGVGATGGALAGAIARLVEGVVSSVVDVVVLYVYSDRLTDSYHQTNWVGTVVMGAFVGFVIFPFMGILCGGSGGALAALALKSSRLRESPGRRPESSR